MASSTEVISKGANPSKMIGAVLDLERIEHNLYRASDHWREFNSKRLFGGQAICQAMVAASKTVESRLHINSLHCYFIRRGSTDIPVVYQVENLRDGGSFSTRSVHAIQNGQTILIMILSFHVKEESPYHHQYAMPSVPYPENLLSAQDFIKKNLSDIPDDLKKKIRRTEGSGILLEYRHIDIDLQKIITNVVEKPHRLLWVRVTGQLDESDENLHRCAAAYISDIFMAWTSYMPHKNKLLGQMVSLDHAMWFHAPFKADEWMLYEFESPQSGAARGLSFGRLWHRDGTLVATISQECLMRPKL